VSEERKYSLQRIAAGDYLLPSNDRRILWRICRYTEGPSSGLDWPKDREVWGIWQWEGSIETNPVIDIEDWSRWEFWDGLFDSRAEAIDAAIREGAVA
jgi:hypothetical protein